MPDLSINVTLSTLRRFIATDSRDWAQAKGDAVLWAVLVGWDCEEDHEHDVDCSGGGLQAMVERHRWAPEFVELIRGMRHAVRRCTDA